MRGCDQAHIEHDPIHVRELERAAGGMDEFRWDEDIDHFTGELRPVWGNGRFKDDGMDFTVTGPDLLEVFFGLFFVLELLRWYW